MKGGYLLDKNQKGPEPNIYADKSSLILEWILTQGLDQNYFSLSEIAKSKSLSLGLVQKVLSFLVDKGLLKTEGLRTSKKFQLLKPKRLLESWIDYYSIVKKCKIWSYRSGYDGRKNLEAMLLKSKNNFKVVKALHSSAESLNCRYTNLDTLEIYLIDADQRVQIEQELLLEQQERGYEVLLIEPYYKKMVLNSLHDHKIESQLPHTSSLLTYLDLYHFPLRGIEQAEYIARKEDSIRKIMEGASR